MRSGLLPGCWAAQRVVAAGDAGWHRCRGEQEADTALLRAEHGSGFRQFDVKVSSGDFLRKKITVLGVWELAHYPTATDFSPARFLTEHVRRR